MTREERALPSLAVTLAVLLGVLIPLGASSTAPRFEIPQVSSLDDGTSVSVTGLLVDFRSYDSGAENLVLLDSLSGSTLKVVCDGGIGPPPSRFATIGDELLVKGHVSRYGSSTSVFTDNEGVSVLKKGRFILTVELLSSNWALFEGDEVVVRGVMMLDGHRLYDCDMGHSIAVTSDGVSVSQFDGRDVLVTGEIRYDGTIMAVTLVVKSVISDS